MNSFAAVLIGHQRRLPGLIVAASPGARMRRISLPRRLRHPKLMEHGADAISTQLDLNQVMASFPEAAESLLLDRYLVDHATASARLFRVYRPTPPHFHRLSDEHLYVLSGTGTVWLDDPSKSAPFFPGTFLFFPRNTVHATPVLDAGPVIFLAIDTPRRHPEDIVFVDPQDGTPQGFIQPVS